ncbi:MAG: hypothetical protein QMC89_05795 [Candidatus Hodarchaeaceae archaeon]|nr:hypothetical protein [Candidatus Hodarchaeaceae archaeon]
MGKSRLQVIGTVGTIAIVVLAFVIAGFLGLSYVEDHNSANFGSEPELWVGSMEREQWRAWLKFDISGLPKSATITGAKLWLYFHDAGEFGGAVGGIGAYLPRTTIGARTPSPGAASRPLIPRPRIASHTSAT